MNECCAYDACSSIVFHTKSQEAKHTSIPKCTYSLYVRVSVCMCRSVFCILRCASYCPTTVSLQGALAMQLATRALITPPYVCMRTHVCVRTSVHACVCSSFWRGRRHNERNGAALAFIERTRTHDYCLLSWQGIRVSHHASHDPLSSAYVVRVCTEGHACTHTHTHSRHSLHFHRACVCCVGSRHRLVPEPRLYLSAPPAAAAAAVAAALVALSPLDVQLIQAQ
jgi:hypothetical protein